MNWLITGGCGFIGVNLVGSLLNDSNNYIRIVDNLKSGSLNKLSLVCNNYTHPNEVFIEKGKVHVFLEDIREEFAALDLCTDIDVIVHLAANTGVPVSVEHPREDCIVNVLGTLNYLEGARHNKVKRFIFASSSAVPGAHEPPYHEELFTRPVSPYGASKATGEGYCHVYNVTYGVATVSLRFSNVYGPFSENKKAQLIPKFIMSAIDGEVLEIYGDGTQTRDFCYVDDLIKAIKLSVIRPNIGGHVFQIATNLETSVQKVTDFVVSSLSKYEIDSLDNIKIKYGNERLGDVKRNFSSTVKAKKMLEWRHDVSIEEGINKTVKWFVEEYNYGL